MDEFDELIAKGSQAAGDEFDDLIAKGAASVPNVQEPRWYEAFKHPIDTLKSAFTPLSDEEWQQKVEATRAPGEQMRAEVERIQGSPWEFAKFAGRSALGLGGQYAAGALGFAPGAAAATPLARTGLGAGAGAIQGGTDALAHGASLPEAAGEAVHGALFGGGLEGVHAASSALGGKTKGAANRKLAERSLSSAELNDLRAEGGGAAVKQTGQELRDLGVTKPRGLLDFFRGNTPERMSENSVGILNNARTELDRATEALTSAPARDVSQITSGYDPKPVTVGQAPVDVSPINKKLHGHADALDYAKNPDKARVYRDLASELTTPARPREPAPITSEEPLMSESGRSDPFSLAHPPEQLPREPGLPPEPAALSSEPFNAPIERNGPMSEYQGDNLLDAPTDAGAAPIESRPRTTGPNARTAQVPFEPGVPEQVDPAALSSEPFNAPIEANAPPASNQYPSDNLLDLPMSSEAGEIERFPQQPKPYMAGTPEVSTEPILDLSGAPVHEVPSGLDMTSAAKDLGATSPAPRTRPFWNPVEMPDDNAFNLLGHDMQNLPSREGGPTVSRFGEVPPPTGQASVDTSYWPAPYEMSRNEPVMPPSAPGLPPAKQTVLEHTPRFQGNSPPPGLDVAGVNQDLLSTPQGQLDISHLPSTSAPITGNAPPADDFGLPPAPKTVMEPAPRFQGNTPTPGPAVASDVRNDVRDLLGGHPEPAPLDVSYPKQEVGELAPLGMSRRAPVVGPIRHGGTEQGPRPTSSNLGAGEAPPVDVSGISPTSAPIDAGRTPQTPRPDPLPDPSTGFTMEQLMAMRRELGNQTRNFSGRPLNKVEGDMGAATRDAWKGAGDALTGAFDQHVEAGNLTPDIVNSYRDANKTFSTIADVNKNLATRTNADFKAPSSTGSETVIGGGYKAVERAKERMLGLNAQYGLGQGIEGIGNAAQAGSDLARMGAGLGWNQNREEPPEIEQARAENPQAPKALVEQKANDSMKETLQKAWYNVLGAFQQ